MNTVIIVGSSRQNGDTISISKYISSKTNWEIINLMNYSISHFDYEYNNQNDDFLPLINNLIDNYDTFVFATPVYWYSMSGIMKVFFDRFTDLLTINTSLGRKQEIKKLLFFPVL